MMQSLEMSAAVQMGPQMISQLGEVPGVNEASCKQRKLGEKVKKGGRCSGETSGHCR
ncbi:hypothetical protein OIDMADRAFT_17390, partial [Oidiodendron maius Zn]